MECCGALKRILLLGFAAAVKHICETLTRFANQETCSTRENHARDAHEGTCATQQET